MGRGRAKAKQVKVARQLKYKSDDTDLDRLRAELAVGADSRNGTSGESGDYDDDEDDDDDSEDAEDDWRLGGLAT
jgi:phosphopantothenoylcysteine synthetase/decarboxylase